MPKIHREFRFFAMQRSGHHAVIRWIKDSFQQPVIFINHFNYKTGQSNAYDKRTLKRKMHPYQNVDWNCAVFNVENADVEILEQWPYIIEGFQKIAERKADRVDCILVIRDSYNNIASEFRKNKERTIKRAKSIVERQKKLLRQMTGKRQYFHKLPIQVILFDRLISDIDYRTEIIRKLKLKIDPKQLLKMGSFSSFDGTKYKKQPSEMKVTERYLQFVNQKKFRNIFINNKELVELNFEVFGTDPLHLIQGKK
jgi:hypothetical protein